MATAKSCKRAVKVCHKSEYFKSVCPDRTRRAKDVHCGSHKPRLWPGTCVAMSNCDGKNCELVSPLPRGKVSEMKCPLGRGLIKFAHSQQVIISGIDVQ